MSSFRPGWCVVGVIMLVMMVSSLPHPAFTEGSVINVSTGKELRDALANVSPGQTIRLADGTYTGQFTVTRSGRANNYIRLEGSRDAVIEGASPSIGNGIHLEDSQYWSLNGFTLRTFLKGIVFDNAGHNEVVDVGISNIGNEGIRFRTCSSNNVVRDSEIMYTGVITPEIGEGIYIGSDEDSWKSGNEGDLGERWRNACDPDREYRLDEKIPDKSHANQMRDFLKSVEKPSVGCTLGHYANDKL